MPADYSNIRNALKAVGYRFAVRRGDRLTDTMLHDAVTMLSPNPLPYTLARLLLYELDEKLPRQTGRPKNGAVTRKRLATAIAALPKDSMPDLLRAVLVDRLSHGLRYTELERSVAAQRKANKLTRDMFICGLRDEFCDMVLTGRPLVHEIIGPIDDSCAAEYQSPNEKATAILADVMRNKMGQNPPSVRRMLNIIYADKTKKKTCMKCFVS